MFTTYIFLRDFCLNVCPLIISHHHHFAGFLLQCRCAGWSCLQWGQEDTDEPVRCHTCDMATQLCSWMTSSTSGVGATTQRAPATYFMPLISVSPFKLNSEFTWGPWFNAVVLFGCKELDVVFVKQKTHLLRAFRGWGHVTYSCGNERFLGTLTFWLNPIYCH